ncbi:MAG TPA: cytochrome b N-terminal domain-containing protein [Pyrinomonadaceae bacterium]|jgi:ubiquinol-cytochrome c reductase cytochrome b subunit|nr:cytochrome b N-terminal domain-containing protein [Pyrinomonadaceae bacterium]
MTPPIEKAREWLEATGGIVAVLLLVQFVTGVLLAFYYVPSVDHAYTTVSYVEKVVSSGAWLRALHHYGSQWLAFFVFLHVIRLFLTRAYVSNKIQWVVAILLLGLAMAAGGTGYSLPWDARAFFSTRIAEGLMAGLPFVGQMARLWLLGGNDISTITLSRFFALHVFVIPACVIAVVAWRMFRSNLAEIFGYCHAIAGGVVFLALAMWSLKYRAPLGPSLAAMPVNYVPRPGAQFLWLYQSLKYLPGGLGSLAGVALPGIVLTILVLLPWIKRQRLIAGTILGLLVVLVAGTTAASYLSDRSDPQTSRQLSIQAAQEDVWRREPFKPAPITLAAATTSGEDPSGGAPVMYRKFCANCHGPNGEGARQGRLNFPPLLDVSAKPRRTVNDIVEILKDPPAYGLSPPMRSFTDKLTDEQMKEIGEWIVKLKR